jgi:hypothetical protein
MNRLVFRVTCAVAVLGVGGSLHAQPPAPGGVGRPTDSPYLNLVRPGGSPALNYFGLVRPELQFRQSIQNLQGAVTANQEAIGGIQAEVTGIPVTGHPTQFLNYGGYFLNSGPSLGAGRAGGPASQAMTAPPRPGGTGGAMVAPPRRR